MHRRDNFYVQFRSFVRATARFDFLYFLDVKVKLKVKAILMGDF